jgi:hypothetical protein
LLAGRNTYASKTPGAAKKRVSMKPYTGNKSPSSLFPKIINSFPAHRVYWELFAGSAQILRKKKAAQMNVAVELDPITITGYGYPTGTAVINTCAISLLDDLKHLGMEHLIYLDPPYLIEERLSGKLFYNFELTTEQHIELLTKLKQCRCFVAISHYRCALYDEMLKDWYRVDMKVSYHGNVVTESLYMNYPPAVQRHETTFVGKNKTQRQQIKRKAARWVKMLQSMSAEERQHILETIIHLGKTPPATPAEAGQGR